MKDNRTATHSKHAYANLFPCNNLHLFLPPDAKFMLAMFEINCLS